MEPRLLQSKLTGAVYVVTRYSDDGEGTITAHTKYDVTEDFNAILSLAGVDPGSLRSRSRDLPTRGD